MKILITGSSGFLGKCFTKYLHDHEIVAANKQNLDLRNATVVRKFLDNHKFDWIINCAVTGRNSLRSTDSNIFAHNISMFINLYTNLDSVKNGIITFGTGAEFGIDRAVDHAQESDIWNTVPEHSYGHSKNLISRLSSTHAKCFILRIFGCFDPSEDSMRPIKKLATCIKNQTPFFIDKDRWFDMISVMDLTQIVQHVMTGACGFRDINAVYNQKTRFSDILRLYCKIHRQDSKWIQVFEQNGMSYTGDSTRLNLLNLPLLGLNKSLEKYGM